MRVAVAYWIGRVSPVFDVADALLLIDMENGREIGRESFRITGTNPMERAGQVLLSGAEVLICGAVSRVMESALSGLGIRVEGFVCGDIDEVVSAFIGGNLAGECYRMPGGRKSWRCMQATSRNGNDSKPGGGQ